MKKRILFIINSMEGGGAERILSHLLCGLDPLNLDLSLLLTYRDRIDYEIPNNVKIYRPPEPKTDRIVLLRLLIFFFVGLRFFYQIIKPSKFKESYRAASLFFTETLHAVRHLKDVINREQPDLMVSFLPQSTTIATITKFFYHIKTPLCSADHCQLSKQFVYYYPVMSRIVTKFFYQKVDLYIAVSEGIRREMVKDYGMKSSKVIVIYNGVDLDSIMQYRDLPPPSPVREVFSGDEYLKIINVGRLAPEKGQDMLLFVLKRLLENNTRCRLYIVGDGPEKERLATLASSIGISDSVYLLGWQSNPFALMAQCHLFVLCSLWEAFPNVLIEAMAVGLPIVARDCPTGPSEILEHGKYGVLVPTGDAEGMADAIASTLEDEDLRRELSRKGPSRAAEFGIDAMIKGYEKAFRQLIDSTETR